MAVSIIRRYVVISSVSVVCAFLVHGVSDGDTDEVYVIKGDSVTLNTGVKTNQVGIKWYFDDTRIAQISVNLSKICTDVQCNDGTERFRDRLKLDHQTGSLTITNITTEHAGVYHLKIRSRNSSLITQDFRVDVHHVPAALRGEVKRKSVKEGESVTLDPGLMKNTNDVLVWYFNDSLIAEMTGDQSEICTDDQCDQRFRDRLKVDQTGSLTITNTRTTDSGDYKLQKIRKGNRFNISSVESFSVNVTDSGLSSGVVAGICVAVLLTCAAFGVAVIYHRRKRKSRKADNEKQKLEVLDEGRETDRETSIQHYRRGSEPDPFEDSALVLLI